MRGGAATLLALSLTGLALALSPGAAAAAGIPAVEVTVTVAGEATGSVAVLFPPVAAEPEEGCAALPAHAYEAKASLSIGSTFKHLLLPLVKLDSEGVPERARARASAARRPRTGSGGSRGGSFSFSGDFAAPEEWPSYCFGLAHHAASAKLSPAAHPRFKPTYLFDHPDFLQLGLGALQGGSVATPARFEAPYPASEPQATLTSLPFFLPPGRLFFPSHSPAAVQVGYDEVGIDWNALQGKLAGLRHGTEFTIHAKGSYAKRAPVPETIKVGEGCVESDFEAAGEAKGSICLQSTAARFTITVHRERLLTVG